MSLCATLLGMTLSEFLVEQKWTHAEAAQRLGVSRSYLTQIIRGQRAPSLALAVKIERLTGGAVTAASLLPAEPEEDAA